MKWRKSGKRRKWLKTGKRGEKDFPFKDSRIKRNKYPYRHRNFKIFQKRIWKEPDPLIDVFQEKDKIIVVAELKGFKKENIKVQTEKNRLILSAKTHGRKYYKSLNLPDLVIPKVTRITYKNGVLEIQLKKTLREKSLNKVAG